MNEALRKLALEDGRYSPEAYRFLFESLDHALRLAKKDKAEGTERHVTGQEVLRGLSKFALDSFGPLAAHVWRSWGIRTTMDWGRIVFLLVEKELLNRQEGDTIDDFREGFDFVATFRENYRAKLPSAVGSEGGKGEGGGSSGGEETEGQDDV